MKRSPKAKRQEEREKPTLSKRQQAYLKVAREKILQTQRTPVVTLRT